MKAIYSEGGPFIVLPENLIRMWGGVRESTFSGVLPNDYEAAGIQIDNSPYNPKVAAVLPGKQADALVLATPEETSILYLSGEIFLVQVHYRDDDFDFGSIGRDWFDKVSQHETVSFRSMPGQYVVFDGACSPEMIADECLRFELEAASYQMSSGLLEPDERTLLSLIRVHKG